MPIEGSRTHLSYYELQFTADELNWVVSEPMGEAPIDLSECKPMDASNRVRLIVYADGRRVDFNETSYCAIVASDRLADLLRRIVPSEVQFLPATVAGDDGSWSVVNVLSRVDCIDHKRSKITYYPANHAEHPGEPRGVLRLVLDPNRIGDRHFLRPRGWEVATVVSETVKRAMEDNLMTGMQFVPVTE